MEENVGKAYKTVKTELEAYGGGLTDKQEIVALSQIDILDEKELKKKAKELQKACGQTPYLISAITGTGMTDVLRALRDVIVAASAGQETALPDRSVPEADDEFDDGDDE